MQLADLQRDLAALEADQRLQVSSGELEKVPFTLEAATYCHKEIEKLQSPPLATTTQDEREIDFEEKKRRHNKKLKIKQGEGPKHSENAQDF